MKDGFSTREVLQLTGTTARQLQWWDEKRIIVPTRDGRRRLYSPEELIEIHVIEEMRRRHISLATVRRAIRFLRRESGVRLSQLASGKSDWHLLLDGKNLYLESDTRHIVNHIQNTMQPVFIICLSEAVRRVEEALPRLKLVPDSHAVYDVAKKPPSRVTRQMKTKEGRAHPS